MIIDSPIISGSYAASGSLNQFGNVIISGSLTVTGNITGTALTATSASYALTASHATNVPQTSSFADNATSASYAVTASYISGSGAGVGFPYSGSAVITGSLLITELSGSGTKYVIADNNGLLSISSGSTAIKVTETITSTTNQTSFVVPNGYTTGLVDVFINGVKLNDAEFTDNDGVTITLATGSNDGDIVEFAKYQPANGVTNNALRQQTTFIAEAGQTVFSASYTPGLLDIFYNGSRLSNNDYTANNGTYFTLATASAVNDLLDVFVYSYQVGAFNGIGGTGVTSQIAYFNTTSSITGSNNFTINGSTMTVTGSLVVSGSGTFTNIGPAVLSGSVNISGSLAVGGANVVLSTQTSSLNVATASLAITASSADNFLVRNILTAQTLVVQTITSSVDFVTGSTRFGSIIGNTHVFTGSVNITGSNTIVGDLTLSGNRNIYLSNTNPAAGAIRFFSTVSGSTKAAIGSYFNVADEGNLEFLTGGTSTRMVINSSGNVGIGTTSPSIRLTISNNGNAAVAFRINDTNANASFLSLNASNSDAAIIAGGTSAVPFDIYTGGTARIRVTGGGNVGVGTTDPATTLTIYKTRLATFQTTQTPNNLYLQSQGYDGSGFNTIDFGSTSYGVPLARIGVGIFGDGTYMAFGTSNSYATGITNTAVTINPTGNVGIGTGISGSPNNRLLVQGGNLAKGTTFGFDGVTDNMVKYGAQQDLNASGQFLDRWIGIDATITAGAAASNIMFFKVYSGGGSGSPITAAYFNGLGNVFNFNNSTTWQQSSDIRIKENIRPINNALGKLCALNPSHFEYKNNLGKTKTGFIAQEFEQVFAGHVSENAPSGDFKQYFEEGEMIKSIDADLIPYLVKAIQEQQTLITELQEKLERNNII